MISGLLPVAVLGLIELPDEQPNPPVGAAAGPHL
jgi:hypothetical protein